MTLLDRFRAVPRYKHPDPSVRLAHVEEIPLSDRITIEAIAREDEDARVRRAAVGKLMDPAALGRIGRSDPDESVRRAAIDMLRDIACESFEGLGESEALDAADALEEVSALGHVARTTTREIVALRALSRIQDVRQLGSLARHAALEAVRQGALERLRERAESAEIVAVALHAEHKETAAAAVDLVSDRSTLEQIVVRGKNKAAVKRARTLLRTMDEQEAAAAAALEREAAAPDIAGPPAGGSLSGETTATDMTSTTQEETTEDSAAREEEARAQAAREDAAQAEAVRQEAAAREAAARDAERRRLRMSELAGELEAASEESDLGAARTRAGVVRRELDDLARAGLVEPELETRIRAAQERFAAREHEAREADVRARKEALARLQNLLHRIEPLVQTPNLSLKGADRALRDIRAALAELPPLPTKGDAQEITRRLKAAQAELQPKVLELREAEEWQQWANVTIQEQLCGKMEALQAVEDPEHIAREVKELQRQWREAADVPRARADALWRRFKAAHDLVWPKCEAHFAARAETLRGNLTRKIALCEQAEALADSTNWLQAADAIKLLQAEWKTIGPVPRGQEKAIWERFRAPCDRFFTRRTEDLARRKTMWAENLAKKTALCERAETLAASTDWDAAAAGIRELEAEWKTIGAVKKTRSDAIWQRFRTACDQFHTSYAHRHDTARAERLAAREVLCREMEGLAEQGPPEGTPPAALLASIRGLHTRWKHELASQPGDPPASRDLDRRFATAFGLVCERWPEAVRGTELDPEANRARMEALVSRVEELARSIRGPALSADGSLSATTNLAAMLKEALAANTIGGTVDEQSRKAAAIDEVRQAQASWSRIGPVPDAIKQPLQQRFERAARSVMEKPAGARPAVQARR